MPHRNFVLTASLTCASALMCGAASSQNYPIKTIRFMVSSPSSASDISARILAQGMAPNLGQPVVVENRPGILAVETTVKAPPDGYTLLLYGSLVWLLPYMRDIVPWDPIRDFVPVSLTSTAPNLVVVHPSLPVKSIKDLVLLAKARPGQLNYSLGSRGAATHLAVELFKSMAGVNIVGIPYKGNVPGLNALLSGEVQVLFPTSGSGGPYVKSGRLRALAVTSSGPSALFPGLPTVAAGGLPGYESVTLLGVMVRATTSEAIIKTLNQEVVRIISRPDVREKFFNTGAESVGSTPEEFARQITSEMALLGKVIKDVGIRADE